MIDFIAQGLLALLGLGAAWMLTEPSTRKQYIGCWLGLMSQPFWVYTVWTTGSWGIGILCIMYTLVYIKGVRRLNVKDSRSISS